MTGVVGLGHPGAILYVGGGGLRGLVPVTAISEGCGNGKEKGEQKFHLKKKKNYDKIFLSATWYLFKYKI